MYGQLELCSAMYGYVMDMLGYVRLCMAIYIIQLSPEGEVNSGGYIPRREASRYICTALHRP